MNILVLGSTGVVGDGIVRHALSDERLGTIFAVSRRPLAHSAERLRTIILGNFGDFRPLSAQLIDVDVVVCALGLSWYQAKSEAQYRKITHGYVMACARVASVANPALRFCFISGHGASTASSQAWARIKAETEQDLGSTFGSRLTVFRPAYVHPVHGREHPYWGDMVMRPFLPFRRFMPRYITDSDEVARAVLYAVTGGAVASPLDNSAIIAAAAAYSAPAAAEPTARVP